MMKSLKTDQLRSSAASARSSRRRGVSVAAMEFSDVIPDMYGERFTARIFPSSPDAAGQISGTGAETPLLQPREPDLPAFPGPAMPLLRALCFLFAVILAGCASSDDPGYRDGYGSSGGTGQSGGGVAGMGRGETVGTLGGAAA